MSEKSVKAFLDYRDHVKVNNDVKVHGHVNIRDRVRVKGRVQAHGHMKTSVSGNVVLISGQVVQISGQIVQISGQAVQISGQAVQISGQFVSSLAPSLLRNGYSQIESTVGGTELSSGAIIFVTLENISGNAPVWIGAIGVNSGTGYLLLAGNSKDISIDNLNKVYVFAETSGQFISWLAED